MIQIDLLMKTKEEIMKVMPSSEEDYTIKQYKAYSKCKDITNNVERLGCQIGFCCPSQKRELDRCLDLNRDKKEKCNIESSRLTKCYAEFARKAFIYQNDL